jgi:type IV pilus assembly protein PilM
MASINFFNDEPLFGLDIGYANAKVMQVVKEDNSQINVLGYGVGEYPSDCIANGVIVNFEAIGQALYDLFTKKLVGSISTKRVACTVPTSRTFNRPMKIPLMDDKQIAEAVRIEAEQYIPVSPDNLYIDYEITHQDDKGIELLMVAAPKNIIDSYIKLLKAVGLQPVSVEPTMSATSRIFSLADPSHGAPSLLIDFGSVSVDIAAFDRAMVVNSTIGGGSDTMNELIAKNLNMTFEEAYELKNKFGISLSARQQEVLDAVNPVLENLTREAKKITRYYNDRMAEEHRRIVQIIIIGGGANMPGLNQYLSKELGLPTKMLNPWDHVSFEGLKPPNDIELSRFITVTGEALLDTREVFK